MPELWQFVAFGEAQDAKVVRIIRKNGSKEGRIEPQLPKVQEVKHLVRPRVQK